MLVFFINMNVYFQSFTFSCLYFTECLTSLVRAWDFVSFCRAQPSSAQRSSAQPGLGAHINPITYSHGLAT